MNQAPDRIQSLHREYLAALRKERRVIRLWQTALLVAFFAVWEAASRFHWVDPLLFSSPSAIAKLFGEKLGDHSLFVHTWATLFETLLGFLIGTAGGALIGAVLWWFPRLAKTLDPYLVVFNAMPKVALGPILIVALGPGFTSIIAMGVVISVIITTIVVYSAFQEVDPNYLKVLRTFGATRYQCFKEAVLPASFPAIISTLKVNVGLAWVGVITGEFLISKQGLGYLIIYGFQVFNFTLVLMSLLIVALLSTVMYQLVALIEKKWGNRR
ncbi:MULTISPECIES: ABC transporter permease [Geobacillus]|uniref:Hydroxymethylpyrimidine ABC transporter transmembrane component n=1 Tax=Geobacillus stearothermophilus TaxID=1422 RepID=A0A150MAB5_GEOSE|nr:MULTISPECIES: ABC transporter permease [Geobacillus]AKU26132.1 ABC transporter permease [Geobacillus sp. LC300]ATA61070.1 ABC-type nitrate-sulfonate-bicarbonate transport system permease component [Geobacillus stearothermophilus]KAF6510565.1 Hydroxymethylpyrimidine ABC transporter transmembrane component [Geobacillus stearothermophilus]KMY58631.1 ABC transporter permease [Geobacillus stearothermophilus]KOR92489.1 ABC transporter permease [Geobacillus stearothermophilus ATCC 12980]